MDMKDLTPGMKLKGTVRNVVDFGAFVDIGVHQDGLVHVSQLSDSFVTDPLKVVKVGDIVDVTVLSVDVAKARIALTMKTEGGAKAEGERKKESSEGKSAGSDRRRKPQGDRKGPHSEGRSRGDGKRHEKRPEKRPEKRKDSPGENLTYNPFANIRLK
jgi:uncharacterized protein